MEGHVFPDQQQLLQFLRRLKEVFDVCDEDADGFIRVEHLEDLGLQFGQGDEVSPGGWLNTDKRLLCIFFLKHIYIEQNVAAEFDTGVW